MAKKKAEPPEEQAETRRDEEGHFVGANSTSFKPGESGNPGGRKAGPRLTQLLDAHLQEDETRAGEDGTEITMTRAKWFVIDEYRKAGDGVDRAASRIWDRIEGKLQQDISIRGDITVNMSYDPVLDGEPDEGEE